MLRATQLSGFGGARGKSFYQFLQERGLDSNLGMCYDFGDINCYNGGQQIADLSPATSNAWRGATAFADTDDPDFVGALGGLANGAFDFVSGDPNLILQQAVYPELDDFVDNNQQSSIIMVCNIDNVVATRTLAATANGVTQGSNIGFVWSITTASKMFFWGANSVGASGTFTSTGSVPIGSWCVLGLMNHEGGGADASTMYLNGNTETYNGGVGAGTSAADSKLNIGARNTTSLPFDGKIGCVASWTSLMTAANFDEIRQFLLGRYNV